MGSSVTKIRDEAKKANEEDRKRMEERLQILEKMVDGRLQVQEQQMLAGERNDQEIHSGTVVEMFKQVNIKMTDKESDDIDSAIGDFFSGNIGAGIGKLVGLAVKAVLGNEAMGEYETTQMFIVWTDNALLRYDMYCYRWNFVAKGVIEETEGVVGILSVKRVIDITKTDPQVLTWAITRQAEALGTPEEAGKLIDDALQVLEKVIKFQSRVKKDEVETNTSE